MKALVRLPAGSSPCKSYTGIRMQGLWQSAPTSVRMHSARSARRLPRSVKAWAVVHSQLMSHIDTGRKVISRQTQNEVCHRASWCMQR